MYDLPEEHQLLLEVVRTYVDNEVRPRADEHEAASRFPREQFDQLGDMDLAGLPLPEDVGGSGLPYRTYLMVLEELARGHATLALALSVHTLSMYAIDAFGTDEQRERFLPSMVSADALGAYCLSEPDAGSDAASLQARAERRGENWTLRGTKAWVTHGGIAERYVVFARSGGEGPRGISAFVLDHDQSGFEAQSPEDKMGLRGSPTAQMVLTDAEVDGDRLLGGEEGIGFRIAMSALDGGRLGISALATGLAQAALDSAVSYAHEREQFGKPIIDFQGVSFLLADMATQVEAGRALYRDAAARRDAGEDASKWCSMSKLFCTDTAMSVTTDAVQVLGGVGYTREFPVERYMREAKVLQIFEGTNQIQRLVIGRRLSTRR
ncbi:MAG: acyl-CoA dehydrogenase family protein [Nitriliruptorales bacterium]|nr:acyl-CoA dehydrogenase family protein [Nitriliruptorales bacterium]